MKAAAPAAGVSEPRRRELRGKLRVAFVLQIAAISAAMLLSVYAAWYVLRDVLIERVLIEESEHYLQRLQRDPSAPPPHTRHLQALWLRRGDSGPAAAGIAALEPGYHVVDDATGPPLAYVTDAPAGRLVLTVDRERVDRLALWFGFVPLSVIVVFMILATWLAYRVSRRAVSPVIWLANQVRNWDPKRPDFHALAPARLPDDADVDVQALAGALHRFGKRIEAFVERERNFTRDASHELRSPLTVIRVAADVLLADGELSEFGERSVTRIKRAARDMEALFEALLILAREDDLGLLDEDFVVNQIVAEEIDNARILVADRAVDIRLVEQAHFALHAPPRVFAVMLANLLRQAALHTEAGTVTVTVGPDFVRVEDGGGSAAPPAEVGRSGDGVRGGHDVGLTIVKRLSDRFGWPTAIESTLGVGTAATIRFPHPQPV